jgi:hypothetical protein
LGVGGIDGSLRRHVDGGAHRHVADLGAVLVEAHGVAEPGVLAQGDEVFREASTP